MTKTTDAAALDQWYAVETIADLGPIIARIHDIAPGHFARRADFLAKNASGTVQWTQKND